ncbi:non-ribosomal peptide synthetase [Amycolatopsis sp. EV170708-02-1]|uniref:non-ribosomal peptide synthetase n=1 Tax=Amycolatopsis sp. EV170708-02-1 TaxID=2919322 RepID=UPI001F0CBE5A|nr:non-ribosomal peptide synthetase [Amycolatopsis sp. EV170708-02-1]UMP06866.1 amino acid adenylation domain-containing protein [Amycolatopsis sp. EV170708-02-1]
MTKQQLPALIADLVDIPAEAIDEHENLIELGLDSITMMRLAGNWRKAGVNVTFADLVATPTLAAWRALLAVESGQITRHTKEIDDSATFPLALMQHAYWVGRAPGQRLGGVDAHFYHEFDGADVDPERLEIAVRALFARHGMLRVAVLDDGTQRVLAEAPWPGLKVHPWVDQSTLDERRAALSHRRMDIASGEVFDVQLSLLPEGRTRVHVSLDMIAADALSLRVLLADLARAYEGEALPPLGYSYPRYLAERGSDDQGDAREYWAERLPTLPGAPQLPASDVGGEPTVVRHHRWLGPESVRALERSARRHGLTTAMALAAAFAETLTAWSAEPRFLLNLPLFDRQPLHDEVDCLVGDFTSSVLLEWDGAAPGSFADRASLLQQRFHADVAHTGYSGVEVLRDLSRLHGEQVLAPVVYTSALGLDELFAPEVTDTFGEAAWIISQGPQVWLDAQVTELGGGLLINWDIREDAFIPGVPDAMFAAYSALLDRLIENEDAWTGTTDLIPRAQLRVRAEVNDTSVVRHPRCLHDRFFSNAAAYPDAPAVLSDGGSITYGDLAARALRLAGHLTAKGIGPGDLVAVSLPKGPDQVIAVLGVLATGAAYLPIGVDQPAARRERILANADVSLLLDDLTPSDGAQPLAEPVSADASSLAYVIYTSGSTGEPKGVEITHTAAVNTVDDLNHRFGIGPQDRTLALSALEFDLSVYDLFGPLSAGGAVVCVRDSGRRDASGWVDLLVRHRATVLNCVPALLDMVLTVAQEPMPLRVVLLGGDRVTTDLPARLAEHAPDCRFIGLGGTTETAIHSTVCEVGTVDPQWTCVPYGTPLGNVRCRVVDTLGRDRPDWVPGELWIGGAGVARGYRGDPVRTQEKFVEFSGVRWYRTGDRARYTPDGGLDFLGRDDHQVKIRGHRVELGEVEAALTAHPGVTAAVAVVTAGRRLAVAVTGAVDTLVLKDFVTDLLPAPMRPDVISAFASLPLTANGKIDRALLSRTLDDRRDEAVVVAAPAGEVERLVAAAWSDVLRCGEVGREQDFFTLGGDSLLATKVIGRLRAAGVSGVSLSDLFARPVLSDLAVGLTLSDSEGMPAALATDPANRYEPFPPTEVQRAYWLGRDEGFTLGGVGCHFYREYDVDDLDLPRLEAAINRLVRRHEMLRAVFDERGDQRVLPEVPWFQVELIGGGFDELRATTSHTVFDPAVWPLFTVRAARAGRRTRLAVGMDNLVLDALSILVFYAELASLYQDPDIELPPIGVSFRDYVLGVERAGLDRAEAYWTGLLPDLPPAPRLPLAKDPADVAVPRFERRSATIEAARWRVIVDRAREQGLTPSAVLLTAFAEVLGLWSARADLTLNVTLFDRKEVHPDIDRVLGDFTSLLLVACRPTPDGGWLDRVRQVQEELWGALDHRDVSAVWVMRELARTNGDPNTTMPVVFTSALGVSADPPEGSTLFADNVWGVSQTPQVWLDHQVTEVEGGVRLNWDAVEELFPLGLLDDMFEAYLSLVDWLATASWRAHVPDLLPARQYDVRAVVNETGGVVPEGALHSDFFRLAAERPDRVAVVGALTYGELADRALRLAAVLGERGAAPGDTVAISLPKGPGQLVAVLGVLAAGCTYVPIGVDQPPARQARMRGLAGADLVVTEDLLAVAADPLPTCLPPADLAYVIFTSGSTGEPKGVETTHRAALNTVADINERFAIGPGDRLLAVSALDFDLSVYDIFGPLSVGGAVVTIGEDDRRDAHRWHDLVTTHGVTVWNTVPALLDMLLVATTGRLPLRVVLVSGDWVGLNLPGSLATAAPTCRFIALGGATEAAIWSNFTEVDHVDPAWISIPYGTPLRNQRFRVVDDLGRDCPDWSTGELWIGGEGVARGYRSAPEQTAAQFVEGPSSDRWYRTGDLGRYWPDGTLEFLGRADQQVKIRGHRIELGEIEAALEAAPGVVRAAVAVTADRRLIAAAVAETSSELIRSHTATLLPAHMLPEQVAVVETLPLTGNGKVDRAAIAALARPADHAGSTAPTGAAETAVAGIWADLLGLDHIGREQNFFTLGGDSLRATKLISMLRGRFGVTLSLSALYAAPTIEAVARTVSARIAIDEEMEEGIVY